MENNTIVRGLEGMLQPVASLPAKPESEEIRTARAILEITQIVTDLPDRQRPVVFRAVEEIKRTAAGSMDENAAAGERLHRIESERISRNNGTVKRGWFGWS